MNLLKLKYLQDDVKSLLNNDFIELSQKNFSSQCLFCRRQMVVNECASFNEN